MYILIFIVGSISGLLFSYRQHGEPFVCSKINIPMLIITILGWVILINTFLNPSLLMGTSIGLFLISFVFAMRPGYGRYETIIGVIVSITIYTMKHFFIITW
jgi:energy-converting hydrogenase A subunit L